MLLARYRHFIVALLMMAFIGQVVASAGFSCKSQNTSSQFKGAMAGMNMSKPSAMSHFQHSGSDVDSALTDSMVTDRAAPLDCANDCCPGGNCSLGGCAVAILPESQAEFILHFTPLINHFIRVSENQLASSLYRPPIFR